MNIIQFYKNFTILIVQNKNDRLKKILCNFFKKFRSFNFQNNVSVLSIVVVLYPTAPTETLDQVHELVSFQKMKNHLGAEVHLALLTSNIWGGLIHIAVWAKGVNFKAKHMT